MKTITLALLLTIFPLAQNNQLPVYGSVNDLKDLTKVYVASDEPGSRNLVLRELNKYKGLTVVTAPDEAEFILQCEIKASTESRGRQRSHYYRTLLTAYSVNKEGRKTIHWTENETYQESGGFTLSRPNETNLARHFIDAIKKLRGEKK